MTDLLIQINHDRRLLTTPAGVFRFTLTLIKKGTTLGPGEKWITIHPHGEGSKGVPVIIREHPDGGASIVGGAGGKLNFLKLGTLRTKEEWKQSARERNAKKKQDETDRVSNQTEDDRASEQEQTTKAKEYHQSKTHENALATIDILESGGVTHGITPEQRHALENPPAADADPEEVKTWRKTTREATAAVRDIQRSYEHRLVSDHEARSAAMAGELPNNLTENLSHSAGDADGNTIAHLQQLPNGQWLATSDDGGKVFDRWDDAAKQHVRNVQMAESDLGYSAQPEEFYEPNQWNRSGDSDATFNPQIALEIARLGKERKENARNEKAAADSIRRGESWQALGEGQAVEPISTEAIAESIKQDAKTLEDAAKNGKLLDLLEQFGDAKQLKRHVEQGGYGQLAEICSDVLKQVPVSRAIVDAIGYSEAAKVFAYSMRGAMTEAEYKGVVNAQQAFHAETSTRIAEATVKQVTPLTDALKGLHEQMLQLEQDMGENPTPEQHMLMDSIAYDAEQLNQDIQQKLGGAIGQLQASAAMSAALGGSPNTLRLSAKAADKILPTGDNPGILAAYGIEAKDLKVIPGPDGDMLQVNRSGMEKLAAGYNPEDRAAYDRAMAIKRGELDEPDFVPQGFSHYAAASFSDAQSARNDFDTTFSAIDELKAGNIPENLEDSIHGYIGARVANGDNPLEVMNDVRSPGFYLDQGLDPYGPQALAVQSAAAEMVKRVSGGGNISNEGIKQAFQAMADDEVAKQRRQNSTDDMEALHNQTLDREPATEALHRTLAAMPMARLLFKSKPTLKERKWLREYGITEVLGQELEATKKAEKPAVPDDVAEEQFDLFGNKISATEAIWNGEIDGPEFTQWQNFSRLMGGDDKAYAAVTDHLRGKFNSRFAAAYGNIGGKPPLIGGGDIQHNDRLLLAKLPEADRNEMLQFMRDRDASDKAKAQARISGRFADDDEWRDRYEQLKGNNRQINLLTADTGRSAPKTDYQRTTLGTKAEDMLHRFAQDVAPNFEQIDNSVGMIPEVKWDGQHVTKQRALKFLEAQKKIGLHFGAGCVHETTMLRCEKTGKFQSFGKWWMDGDRPWVQALDETTGKTVIAEAGEVFVKGYEEMHRVTLANGSSIIVTAGHRFLGRGGWVRLGSLSIGDSIRVENAHADLVDGARFASVASRIEADTMIQSVAESSTFAATGCQTFSNKAQRWKNLSQEFFQSLLSISAPLNKVGEESPLLRRISNRGQLAFGQAHNHPSNLKCRILKRGIDRQSCRSIVFGGRTDLSNQLLLAGCRDHGQTFDGQTRSDTELSYLGHCLAYSHLGDEQPRPGINGDSTPLPLPIDALALGPCNLHEDDPLRECEHTRNGLLPAALRESVFSLQDALKGYHSELKRSEFLSAQPQAHEQLSQLTAAQHSTSDANELRPQEPYCSWSEILKIENTGMHFVFDVTVPVHCNYIAHGMINHNSGKSSIMLGMFSHLHSQGKVKKALICLPNSIIGQFVGESATFLQAGKYKYAANLGWDRDRRIAAMKDSHDIFITSRESMAADLMHLVDKHLGVSDDAFRSMPEAQQKESIESALRKEGIDPAGVLLAIDEAHDITARKGVAPSKRSLALNHFGGHAGYYVQATGDPLKNDLSEAFNFLHSVAPDKFSDQSKFLAEYSGNRRALQRAMAPYSYAATTKPTSGKNVLRMREEQPKIPANEHVSQGRQKILDDIKILSEWQTQHRATLKETNGEKYQATTEDFNAAWDVPEVRAAIDRLGSEDTWGAMDEAQQQAAIGGQIRALGGLKRTAMSRLFHRAPYEQNPKAQWTVEHAVQQVKETGEAGVVFSASSQAAEMLVSQMQKRGLKVGYIHGGLSADGKTSERVKFQDKGEYDVLVCTDAAQTGLNLTRGKWLTHYDVPLTDKAYGQRSARIHRLKQDQDTRIYTPMLDTPEEKIAYARMKRKASIGNPLKAKAEMLDDSGLAGRIAA